MPYKNYLAKNLTFLRVSRNLKQHEIQDSLGFKRNTWSNWENEKSEPSLEILLKIAHFFGIDVGKMITEDLERYTSTGHDEAGGTQNHMAHDEGDGQYKAMPCYNCNQKEEMIDLQRQTIKALQGQVDALQLVINPKPEKT